jgi:hypothetical protein
MLIIAVLSLICLGQADPLESNSPANVLSAKGGRYVFGEVGSATYMLDTQTGRLWMQKIDMQRSMLYLAPIP